MSIASRPTGGTSLPDWMGTSVLDTINIASPCPASWDAMQGNDSAHFCGQCRQNVYDFSQMTRAQAEALIVEKEGHLCGRYYRRTDGRVVTRDCQPKVLSRKPYWLAVLFAFIGMVVLVTWRVFGTEPVADRRILRDLEPFRTVMEWIDPTPPPPPLMGKICVPAPPTPDL